MLALLLAVVGLLALVWDWNWFRPLVERGVEQKTGRAFSIDGNLDVDLGWQPRVSLESIRMANPSWTREPQFFSAERASLRVDLRELLSGRLLLPEVELIAPRIDLETAPGNENNWQLAKLDRKERVRGGPRKGLPRIGMLRVDRGELVYFDPLQSTDLRLQLATAPPTAAPGLHVQARGRLRSQDFKAQGRGGPVLLLTDGSQPYPFNAEFTIGRTRGKVAGSITAMQARGDLRLRLELAGATLADLHRLTALSLPDTPPYAVAGLLIREGPRWTFRDFSGRVGDSDLSGTASVIYADHRPRLTANLRSRQLDLDDLAGFVGAAPQTGAGETASTAQERQARRDDARARVLPDHPVNLVRLRAMDADVRFQGLSLRNKQAPLDNLSVHLLLEKGMLRMDPLDFGVAGGNIVSRVRIDAREDLLALDAELDFSRLDLARLLPGDSRLEAGGGLIGGRAHLRGRGASTAAILGSAEGELGIAMRSGRFSNLLVEGLGLDVAEAIRLFVGGDRSVRLRCAVMDLQAQDGVLRPRSMVIDTTDTQLIVDGSMSLREETLDLTLHPLPKDFSPLALRSPLHLRGSFKEPRIALDKKFALRGGAAAILGALINPLAALLPLIESGPGKNADCDALIAAARVHSPVPGTGVTQP